MQYLIEKLKKRLETELNKTGKLDKESIEYEELFQLLKGTAKTIKVTKGFDEPFKIEVYKLN